MESAVNELRKAGMMRTPRIPWLVISCVAAYALVAAAPAEAAPNGLDSAFGGDGKVTTDFAGNADHAKAVVLQPDGKIVAVGDAWSEEPAVPFIGKDFALARYKRDGSLDATFGGDGKVTTDVLGGCAADPFEFCGFDTAEAAALQADGKIVVAGRTQIRGYDPSKAPINTDVALARYNADGTLDTTFGGDGRVTTDVLGSPDPRETSRDGAKSVAIQPDGKIIAAGYTQSEPVSGLLLVRYNTDGTLDSSFGNHGKVVYGDNAFLTGMALQADGRIVVTALTPTGFVLARYTRAGAPDGTFGTDGKVQTDATSAVTIQPDGQIVVAGTRSSQDGGDFGLARYNPDGTPDAGFGDNGKVRTDFLDADFAYAVAIQSDGGIVAAGAAASRTTTAGGFALARYNADGTLDANGGDDGKTITEFGGVAHASANGMAIQPDGRIVLAGTTCLNLYVCSNSDFALARYTASGSWRLDPPGHREVHPCVNGSFVDLNAVFGVPEQFVCGQTINAGELWRPLAFWFVGPAYYTAPPGYVPAAETPIEDLVSKLDAVKVVVDPGTKQERTTTFSPAQALRTDVTLDQFDPEAPPFPMAVTLPRMQPLKVGAHTVEVVWVLHAMHCDGLGTSVADNCLPAGNVSFGRRSVTVAAP
jgi:uncharacterized delta-60 repeat protein